MRIGELVKVRNKDIQFRKPQIEHSFKNRFAESNNSKLLSKLS